ncbi:hypothetical protein GLOIN_2v1699753 [Rhizophagus irregularis DAOM 181602=DAOM 197198]|uniref:Uncharacterized protein n=1 Tax=Rhizophagus irregularis (strain DAOM 181602 / DAOM 197198 / MUCL 43194) TaxID=747089 RepID=A0A2P4P9F9_RHIID|nr:hypothetical protein GLOIN_2v1699753 [Rhizophagus irregularis DAOM 181602=DAOM 197198]POG62026.1 hypothetical protein GLOIN_2v1699753 [Rhizophagus irregularis DAOM 181602=DAOM 197198]|eukprot:XP_025168892.1 hypothetical protein GLOIN_2v1699753 [Rhizophagus irregularis DAOM 181602=DAOM 197198]
MPINEKSCKKNSENRFFSFSPDVEGQHSTFYFRYAFHNFCFVCSFKPFFVI